MKLRQLKDIFQRIIGVLFQLKSFNFLWWGSDDCFDVAEFNGDWPVVLI
jgi:hypothetical protein